MIDEILNNDKKKLWCIKWEDRLCCPWRVCHHQIVFSFPI